MELIIDDVSKRFGDDVWGLRDVSLHIEATAASIVLIRGGRLLRHALPEDLLRGVAGKVWTWLVPSTALAETKARFDVSATVRRAEGVLVRVVSDGAPVPEAEPVAATLEDAYLHAVAAASVGAA